jgi:hypothetical protein
MCSRRVTIGKAVPTPMDPLENLLAKFAEPILLTQHIKLLPDEI